MFALLFIQVNLLTRKCRESNKAVEKTDVEAMQITNDPEKRMQDTWKHISITSFIRWFVLLDLLHDTLD